MAGKRGAKRKQPLKATAEAAESTAASNGKRSKRKFKTEYFSDLSDEEHLKNETVIDKHEKQKLSSKLTPARKKSTSIQRNNVEFSLSNVTAHLTCELCRGYYRDCHTIVDCLHSFCRSCLVLFFDNKGLEGKKRGVTPRLSCPTCELEVGPHPFRRHTSISTVQILPDRTLQEVVDKLFPKFKVNEVEEETKFYAERKINLKAEYQMLESSGDANDKKVQDQLLKAPLVRGVTISSLASSLSQSTIAAAAATFMNDNIIELRLQPDMSKVKKSKRLPALLNRHLRTSGKLKVISLKKYLIQRLNVDKNNMLQSIEILCNGHPMGNELNLTFIYRTMWLFTTPDEVLTLTYRLGTDV